MSRKILILGTAILMVAALFVACGKENSVFEPSENNQSLGESKGSEGEIPELAGANTWPQSLSDFRFPFEGVNNNYYRGPIWKITCGYNSGYHVNTWYPPAGRYSIDLKRDDGHPSSG